MNIIFFIVLIFVVILFLASSVVLSIVRWVLSLIGLVPGAKSRRGTSEGGTQRMYHKRAGDASSNVAAQWKNQYRYVLSFNSNGGSTVEPITKEWCDDAEWTFTWDQTKNPTRTGYTFMGWATEANSNDVVIGPDSNSYKITGTPTETETKTLHAIWQRNTGTVVLDYSGDGAPVIVTVECTTSEGGVDSEKIRIQTVITGDVTLSNLPTGTYSVTAEPGRGNYTASANPGSVTIGKGESKTVTVTTGAKGNNWLTGFARAINRCS